MKMYFFRLLALTACAAMMGAAPMEPAFPQAPVRVWGTVQGTERGGIHLTNSNPDDPYNDMVLHLSAETAVVDAVTGLPLSAAGILPGDTVYAWVGPAMTLSLPPQATAQVVVTNIPADFGAPQYYEVLLAKQVEGGVAVTATNGTAFTVPESTDLSPWRTRQIVTIQDIVPGSGLLVWRDDEDAVEKAVLFA